MEILQERQGKCWQVYGKCLPLRTIFEKVLLTIY